MTSRPSSFPVHVRRAAAVTAAVAALGLSAACGIEYRPGGGGSADSAAVIDSAARALAAPAVSAPLDSIARRPLDSLDALGNAAPPPGALTFPRTAVDSSPAVVPADLEALRARALLVPVASVRVADLRSTFAEARGGGTRPHEALDIPATRGTQVVSADDGRVAKLFTSAAGGLTVYVTSGDPRYMLYYAHLDRYRDGLVEGATVRKGEPLGFVGSTGDAAPDAPHLHFAIARVASPARWWTGTPIDPFLVLR